MEKREKGVGELEMWLLGVVFTHIRSNEMRRLCLLRCYRGELVNGVCKLQDENRLGGSQYECQWTIRTIRRRKERAGGDGEEAGVL